MKDVLTIGRLDFATAAVSFLSGVLAACMAGVGLGHVAGGAVGFVVAFVTAVGRQRQRAALQSRIDKPALLHWDVVVNNVRVGALSDAQYAGLEKAVLDDWRLYGAQAVNLAKVVVRTAEMLIFAVPVTLFWLGLAVAIFDPKDAAVIVQGLRTASPAEIVAAVAHWAPTWLVSAAVLMSMFALLASPRLGYENKFNAELGEAVRRRLRVAAVGRLMLVPVPASAA